MSRSSGDHPTRIERTVNPKIVLIDSQQSTIDDLSTAFRVVEGVSFAKVDRALYSLPPPPGLDAIFLILPAAERWGAMPAPGRCLVLQTTSDDQHKGMPPYVVTGVVMRPEDPRGPLPETRLLIISAIEAVREFNARSTEKINRLGFWANNLLIDVTPAQLAQIFCEIRQV